MSEPVKKRLEPHHRKMIVGIGLRSMLTAGALVALYYLLPIGQGMRLSVGLRLVVGLALFVAVLTWQVLNVVHAENPGVRAIQALAFAVPLFLLLFAATYFVMSTDGPGNFSQEDLTRTDALYFSVTIFSTVGFGDISPVSQVARAIVSVQMILDLLILGFGVNAFFTVAKFGRERQTAASADDRDE